MPVGVYKHKKGYRRPPFSKKWKKAIGDAFRGKPLKPETKIKMSLAKKGKMPKNMIDWKGEKHPKWIKDRTKVKKYWTERNNPEYKWWRKKVLARDRGKCRVDTLDCAGRVVVHHILGWKSHPELRYEINNGITLCHAHHPRKRMDEQNMSPYFQNLVAEIK